ncbi:Uncharacterized protein GBIM_05568, partial [Gryllus bimaculatus]
MADGPPGRLSARSAGRGGRLRDALGPAPVEEDNSTVKQVIKMLVAVVVLFVVCWAPLLVLNVLRAYGVVPANAPGAPKHAATAFHLMAYFNSCINPLVVRLHVAQLPGELPQGAVPLLAPTRPPRLRHRPLSQTRTTSVRCHTVSIDDGGAVCAQRPAATAAQRGRPAAAAGAAGRAPVGVGRLRQRRTTSTTSRPRRRARCWRSLRPPRPRRGRRRRRRDARDASRCCAQSMYAILKIYIEKPVVTFSQHFTSLSKTSNQIKYFSQNNNK